MLTLAVASLTRCFPSHDITQDFFTRDLALNISAALDSGSSTSLSGRSGVQGNADPGSLLQPYFLVNESFTNLVSTRLNAQVPGDRPGIRLVKLIVLLSTNNLLQSEFHDTFESLINLLQDTHPLEQFLNLIVEYNLFHTLGTLLDLHHIAIEIFSGNALLYAVEIGNARLINLLLNKGCPLHAQKFNPRAGCHVTALELAIMLQDLETVRNLLKAGCDLCCHGRYSDSELSPFAPVLQLFRLGGTHRIEHLNVDIFRLVMDEQVSKYSSAENKRRWLTLVGEAIIVGAMNVLSAF